MPSRHPHPWQAYPLGVADFYGGDIGAEILATTWLNGFVNYSYQQIGQSLTDLARRETPHSKLNVGLRGVWDNGISAETTFYYVGAANYPLGIRYLAGACNTNSPQRMSVNCPYTESN